MGDRIPVIRPEIEEGRIYKSQPTQDWGIKIIEIEPHGKKAVVEYVSCGCALDTPHLGEQRVYLMEYIAQHFPIPVAGSESEARGET